MDQAKPPTGTAGISEAVFAELAKERLGNDWDKALQTFRNYGPHLSFDVANVMLKAAEGGMAREILSILDRHYDEHLQFQHPQIRGMVTVAGRNPSKDLIVRISTEQLGLEI